jgi:hypothetical protein
MNKYDCDLLIAAVLCYNFSMDKNQNWLVSELKLSDLKELADTYLKLIKVENKGIKEKAEKSLLEILDLMDKARNKEIMTVAEYSKKMIDDFGGVEEAIKLIEKIKKSKKKITP